MKRLRGHKQRVRAINKARGWTHRNPKRVVWMPPVNIPGYRVTGFDQFGAPVELASTPQALPWRKRRVDTTRYKRLVIGPGAETLEACGDHFMANRRASEVFTAAIARIAKKGRP